MYGIYDDKENIEREVVSSTTVVMDDIGKVWIMHGIARVHPMDYRRKEYEFFVYQEIQVRN